VYSFHLSLTAEPTPNSLFAVASILHYPNIFIIGLLVADFKRSKDIVLVLMFPPSIVVCPAVLRLVIVTYPVRFILLALIFMDSAV